MADITPIASLNGELAMPEKVWMQGPPGPQGPKGDTGAAATVTVGTVTTGEPGTDAIVRNSGTENAAVLDFIIPKGETGAAGAAGADGVSPTVSTSKSGNVTTITIVDASGTKTATINDGAKGDTGPAGPAGVGVPDGGTAGQLLGKTESGTSWIDPPKSGVQPDWNQHDSTAADYVKNRPFYTGNPVETVLVEESTVEFADIGNGLYFAGTQTLLDATVGAPYKVYWDGASYECECVDVSGNKFVGNLSISGAGSDTGEPFIIGFGNSGTNILTANAAASHTFSISGFVPEVVKIDEKYLPDTVATKQEVEVAQTVADKNKETLLQMLKYVSTFKFDKQTSGRDTFVFNAFNYYKISDFNPAPEDVISFIGTAENGEESSTIRTGSNCVEYGRFIVVASAGNCELPITDTDTGSFTAPSAGLYALYVEGHTSVTAGTGQFTLMQMDGLTIKSSTANSTKRFRITVDDSGTISATEVT